MLHKVNGLAAAAVAVVSSDASSERISSVLYGRGSNRSGTKTFVLARNWVFNEMRNYRRRHLWYSWGDLDGAMAFKRNPVNDHEMALKLHRTAGVSRHSISPASLTLAVTEGR